MPVQRIKIYFHRPDHFTPTAAISVVWLVVAEQLLFVQKSQKSKFAPLTWSPVGGKISPGEGPESAAIRETFEEIGVQIDFSALRFLTTLYVKASNIDFIYQMFEVRYSAQPIITLSSEHQSYVWVTLQEALKLELMPGVDQTIDIYQKLRSKVSKGL